MDENLGFVDPIGSGEEKRSGGEWEEFQVPECRDWCTLSRASQSYSIAILHVEGWWL